MAYRQVQSHHTVAAAGVRERVRRCNGRGGCVCGSIPCKTVAGERRGIARVAVAHRQVQRHQRVATIDILKHARRSNGRSFRIGRAVPCEAVTSMSSRIAINNSPDIQMQSHHTVTAARVRVSMLRRNGWSFRIGYAMPSETDTSKRSSITCVAVPHCQMQRNH